MKLMYKAMKFVVFSSQVQYLYGTEIQYTRILKNKKYLHSYPCVVLFGQICSNVVPEKYKRLRCSMLYNLLKKYTNYASRIGHFIITIHKGKKCSTIADYKYFSTTCIYIRNASRSVTYPTLSYTDLYFIYIFYSKLSTH